VTNPPAVLDGARVILTADLAAITPTGRTTHTVNDAPLASPEALAIATYDDETFYLFYCDRDWVVLTDTLHDSIDAAVAQAHFEFDGVAFG
jgi:hypothetical protein